MITPNLRGEALLADINAASDDAEHLHIWWLGQSGFLLKHDGRKILFDPYLSDSLTEKYVSTDKPHVRMTERCIAPEQPTGIDLITSSHLHTDHFDAATLLPLVKANRDAVFVHPTALFRPMRERLGSAFPAAACGLRDGETIYVADCEVHGIVAAHNVVDRDDAGKPRCMGFVLRTGPFLIYHSGDTLWHDDIVRQVREVGCHVAFVPINGNKPERKVSGNLNGTEAAAMAKALGAIMAVPHHFDMFEFNTESPEEFTVACQRIGQPHRVLRCGERLTLSASDLPKVAWTEVRD